MILHVFLDGPELKVFKKYINILYCIFRYIFFLLIFNNKIIIYDVLHKSRCKAITFMKQVIFYLIKIIEALTMKKR